MAFPNLTPSSTTSAITLPVTGTTENVASSLAIGFYSSALFVSGAVAQVAYTYKRLGGDVLDIELTEGNVFAAYEESVLEYSYIINLHQAKNALSNVLGSATASFDHNGNPIDGDAQNIQAELKYPKFKLTYPVRVGKGLAKQSSSHGL